MSRLNLVSTDTATENKGNRREQPLSIRHPLPPFPPSLLSPLLLLLLKSTIKNTISNLKHSPGVKLDWNPPPPVLKEITSGAEFFVFTVSTGSQRGQGGRGGLAHGDAHRSETNLAALTPAGARGHGYIFHLSRYVQPGPSPASSP